MKLSGRLLRLRSSSSCKMAKRLSDHTGESGISSFASGLKNLKNECFKKFFGEPLKPVTADRSGVKDLPPPRKSASDKKEYKVILLPNGLTALLISDVKNLVTLSPRECSLDGDEDDCGSSASEMDDCSSGEEEEMAPLPDQESVFFDEDKRDCPRKTVSSEEKLAAVGMCIGVGSFSDPQHIPGLAHFLEHMVFMGSEKFPGENDFDEFVKKHGGCDNASTECETTTFYFECHERRLLRTMDMFAQFFISPLMKREAMTREREAIESEFQMSVTSDYHRKVQLIAGMALPNHPATNFTWGNIKTLRDNISDDDLYETVHKFRSRHYSAHRMTLAVQARLPLHLLEDWVLACFSEVPTNYLPPDDFSSFEGRTFEPAKFCKFYTVNPVKDVCTMDLTWFIPTMRHHYRVKPIEYVSWFLGHEGKGSLLSFLRKKVWALEISTGSNECDFENNSLYCLFTVSLSLTEAGIQNVPDIIKAVFGYIKMLQNKGPQESLFKEMQSINDTSFRFQEEVSAADYVEWLCSNMQIFPSEDIITGDDLFFEYDPEILSSCLQLFRLDNMNIIVSTKRPPNDIIFDQTEPWFGTQYNVVDIPKEWLEMWDTAIPDSSFALPEANKFIAEDFALQPVDNAASAQLYPEKILHNEIMELYFKQDAKFLLPNTCIFMQFVTPLVSQSPYNSVMQDMLISILKQQLVEEVYPAGLAQLSFHLEFNETGLSIKCWGFSQKVPALVETIITGITNFKICLDPCMFAAVKEENRKKYSNFLLKPKKVSKNVRMALLLQTFWTILDKYNSLSEITFDGLKSFIDRLLNDLYFQFLVQGNISKEDAVRICENVTRTLRCKPLLPELIPQIRVMQIPLGEICCRVKSFNHKDTNCITTNYYQSGKATIKDVGIAEMLVLLMEEPVYNILRTREQLGYHVFTTTHDTFGILGFSVSVVSQADKFSVDHVDSRIEAFLQTFTKDLKKLKSSEFEDVLQSIIKLKQCTDLHLKEEVDRNWAEILNQEYVFDRKMREIECLKSLKPSILFKWFSSHVSCGNKSNYRKLSVQVEGYSNSQMTDTIENLDGSNSMHLPHSSLCNQDEGFEKFQFEFIRSTSTHPKEYFISDINACKQNLAVFPVHKIIS